MQKLLGMRQAAQGGAFDNTGVAFGCTGAAYVANMSHMQHMQYLLHMAEIPEADVSPQLRVKILIRGPTITKIYTEQQKNPKIRRPPISHIPDCRPSDTRQQTGD